MKIVPLKIIAKSDIEPELNYRDMITTLMRHPNREGLTIDDVRKGLKVLDALEETEVGDLYLEDADHSYLIQKLNAFKWPFASKAILEFHDDLTKAKAVKKEKCKEDAEEKKD
jgi:hypothetical protein